MSDPKPLNVRCAEALGWKAWRERRGDYTLAVTQAPDEPEPWKSSRTDKSKNYQPISLELGRKMGFVGRGLPPYGDDTPAGWAATGPLIGRFELNLERCSWEDPIKWVCWGVTEGDARGVASTEASGGNACAAIAEWVAQYVTDGQTDDQP